MIQTQGLNDGGGVKVHTSSSGTVHGGGGSHTFSSPTIQVAAASNKMIYPDTGTIPWMRYLYIEFKNNNGQSIGVGGYDDSLSIVVKGTKTLASVGDSASITIYNLPMMTLLKLMQGGYLNNVDIYCGYYNTAKIKIFSGGVSYLEEGKSDKNTSILTIECANKLISNKLQARNTLSLQSGINMYQAIEEVTQAFGVAGQIEIDECLKEDELKGALSKYSTLREWIEAVISSSSKGRNYAISTSTGIGKVIGYRKMGSGDTYVINTRDVNLQNFPTISYDGLKIVVAPIYAMTPGDIISISNVTTQTISVLGQGTDYMGAARYIDKDGLYNIREMNYTLTNRSDDFNMEVLAYSRNTLQQQMKGED